jgi:hypothetical protein
LSVKYRLSAFYNGVNSFRAAFPDLNDAIIEWRETRGPDDETRGEFRKIGFRRGNFTQGLLACSNPACHEGGYQIDRLIAGMRALEETERTGVMLCSGREVNEEVRRGPVRCPYRIEFRAALTLRGEDEPEEQERRRPQNRRGRNRGRRRGSAA